MSTPGAIGLLSVAEPVDFSSSLPAGVEAQAQAEAERFFGAGPAPAWQPAGAPHQPRPGRRWAWWLGAASCLVVVSVAALLAGAWWMPDENGAGVEPPVAGDPAGDLIDEPLPVRLPAHVPARPVAAAAPPSPTLNITRRGAEWRIEAVGVSRLLAAQRLAQVSGSPLSGNFDLLAASPPLQLSWQGRGAAGAWQAVLGSGVNYAAQCGRQRCRVWIIEAGAGGALPAPAPRPPVIAAPALASVDVAAAPPQSASTDPRVAAHHD